jgi:hypothetical protein
VSPWRRAWPAAALLALAAAVLVPRAHWAGVAVLALAAGLLALRLRRGLPAGLAWRHAWPVLALLAAIAGAWPWVMAGVVHLANGMRAVLPHDPDTVMAALPLNDPRPWSAWLGGERFLGAWTAIYLAGFLVLPLAALGAALARGQRAAALLAVWSHAGPFLPCLPLFVLWPVSDPWQTQGWFGGAACPWWWQGMHTDLRTFTCPSLHVGVAVAAALAMGRVARARCWRWGWWAWAWLVAASTLAVRTHWLIDLPLGALCGWLGHAAGLQLLRRRWLR